MQTEQQIIALVEAMDQLLDDMGQTGQSVCLAAKAQARIAFEPFINPEAEHIYISLEAAKIIIAEAK